MAEREARSKCIFQTGKIVKLMGPLNCNSAKPIINYIYNTWKMSCFLLFYSSSIQEENNISFFSSWFHRHVSDERTEESREIHRTSQVGLENSWLITITVYFENLLFFQFSENETTIARAVWCVSAPMAACLRTAIVMCEFSLLCFFLKNLRNSISISS